MVPLLLVRRTRPLGAIARHPVARSHHLGPRPVLLRSRRVVAVVRPVPSERFGELFEQAADSLRPRLRRVLIGVVAVLGVALTVANVTPLQAFTVLFLQTGSSLRWYPYLTLVLWAAGASSARGAELAIVPATAIVVALVAVNAFIIHLEPKTALEGPSGLPGTRHSWTCLQRLLGWGSLHVILAGVRSFTTTAPHLIGVERSFLVDETARRP